jgi:cystathionine beta-lyase/cystathionine gamma-synthase
LKKETKCIHIGNVRDSIAGGINTPIFASSAFEYIDREDIPYPRNFNTPNQRVIVEKLCALEGAEDGMVFSSGMAAISTSLLSFAGSGDHVVMMDGLYGGTHSLAANELRRMGIQCTFAAAEAEAVCEAVKDNTRAVMLESPTNPLLSVIDIRKVAEFARGRGVVTLVDNTFATPINQTPLKLGADVVIHSGTKYLGGHSDLCCGVAVASREKAGRIRSLARHLGGSVNALTCYLLDRSLKTLALRVERQTTNASRIAEFMARDKAVRRVFYPGLPDFPGHEIARSQMADFGAMLSFDLDGGHVSPQEFIGRLRLIRPVVSLGGIETTICSPAMTSHVKLSAAERKRIGITDSLLRLSVGIEHVEDLIAELDHAMHPA